MSRFDALDAQIIKTISEGRLTTKCGYCQAEAEKYAPVKATAWRIVDRRQQALRRAGKIRYVRNSNNKLVWEVCE